MLQVHNLGTTMADNTSLPPYARHTPESSASSATPAYKEPRRHQSQARRPTTPEIKAPVALLINSGTSLHSPSPSLLTSDDGETALC